MFWMKFSHILENDPRLVPLTILCNKLTLFVLFNKQMCKYWTTLNKMATPLQYNLIAVVESSTVSTDILGPTYSLFPYGTRTLNMYLVGPRHLEQTPLRINQNQKIQRGANKIVCSCYTNSHRPRLSSLLCWYHWRLGQRSNENLTKTSSLFLNSVQFYGCCVIWIIKNPATCSLLLSTQVYCW